MPEQILLQGKILGTEEFLLAGPAEGRSVRSAGEDLLAGKSQWITLLCEVLPRALLADFFPKSERVTFKTFTLDPSVKARLSQRLEAFADEFSAIVSRQIDVRA